MKEQQLPPGQRQEQVSQTEERDIFKKAAAYFAKQSG
jgi:hypothetical protein